VLASLCEPLIVFANGHVIRDDGAPAEEGMRLRRFVSATDATAHALERPLEVPAHGRLLLIDSFEGQASGYVADARFPIRVGEGAKLERVVLLDDAADAVSITLTEVELEPGASFHQTVLASGAKRQRFETRVRHHGGAAEARLDGIYLISGQRHSDQTTLVEHLEPGGATQQLTKGMVQDQARGVFQGRIVVAEGADGTDAKMGHHALVLSDRAEVDAKPELEIWADDVACAHGNTVGALDEEALFYARSRGIPEDQARAMLIGAFLAEVADRIEHIQARELAHQWITARLGGEP
jgi:Fe-S cluster assembly protein SufD